MTRKQHFSLMAIDAVVYMISAYFILVYYPGSIDWFPWYIGVLYGAIGFAFIIGARMLFRIYEQIWRYAGPGLYVRLMLSDLLAGILYLITRNLFFTHIITFPRVLALFMLNLLCCMSLRHLYQWAYQHRAGQSRVEKAALKCLRVLTGVSFADEKVSDHRIRIAIIGAGNVGVMLADELRLNPRAVYEPICFVDIDRGKVGREIGNLPVLEVSDKLESLLKSMAVQEVVFALPNVGPERRMELYEYYSKLGYKIKSYDFPMLSNDDGSRRQIHDFNIEDLLFRSSNSFLSEETMAWYRDKSVLITGGGGSIGSELARQIAHCGPRRLVLLDEYENGVYDVQQELANRYGDELNLRVEIADVCDKDHVDKIFRENTPDIVLHAAAHKHVPLMERNVLEAVRNNVFGTLNVVEACERYGVSRFIMVSTDKAVNPTNVMGATKRMCEMIIQSRTGSRTSYSATRFGNVLGSNGSVIPLFKQQIANGGPVTVTDKRIIRYFMTIPEAAQLVMTSGAMAGNGELYVLDMGKPVRIIDLAENMIRLSGLEPYRDIDIVEKGLRPGEKLYEELLIKTEELEKTENSKIFIEKDKPLSREEIEVKLEKLRSAIATQSNRVVRQALKEVIPTYRSPEEVNRDAVQAEEMQKAAGL